MSNFICEYCGAEIIEDWNGFYVTGCAHFPIEVFKPSVIELNELFKVDTTKKVKKDD